jgi:hypothetical protein
MTQILKIWVEHFDELLNKNKNFNCQQPPEDYIEETSDDLKPTKEETEEATGKLKNRRAPKVTVHQHDSMD